MLTDRRPILLANARVVDPSRDFDGPGDVLIADGMIRDSKRGIGAAGVPEGTDIVNCAGKIVAPGLIDMRAFVGEPGASHRETFASASQAAAAGGITTIICQPDTSPVIDNSATVDFVLRRARDTAIVNIHPMAALTKGLAGQEMTEIGLLKAAGAVAFTDGDRSVTNAQVMRRALTYARDFDALIVHHTEDPDLVGEGVMNEGEFAARLGLIGIPNAAESVMLERDMRLVALTGGRYHAASLSSIESLEILKRARDAGLDVILHASPEGRNGSFKSQFKRADASGASYAVIIGDDEVTQGVAQIKPLRGDPTADAQQTVPSNQLVDRLIDAMVANND